MREMAAERARARLNDRMTVADADLSSLVRLGSQMQGSWHENEFEHTYRTTFMHNEMNPPNVVQITVACPVA
jgi:hypothetical protein